MTTRYAVRHAGSPQSRDGLTAAEVLDGLREGVWDPTDEVRGPGEEQWLPLESHPHFEEAVADLEEPPPPQPDETKLDMNPLIDVALVLLIFFILTTTYEALRKTLDVPTAVQSKGPPRKVDRDLFVRVSVKPENGETVVRVDNEKVPLEKLDEAVARVVTKSGKRELYLDAGDVPWGAVVAVIDAATAARVEKIHMKGATPPPPPKK